MADTEKKERKSATTLTDRERKVLDAVVRIYVETAEPAGSRNVARRSDLGVSPATVRNTMSDLEEKGFLFHPHTSAGRVPTDQAYRLFVEELMRPAVLTEKERERLEQVLEGTTAAAVERLVRNATRALSVLSHELGVAAGPSLDQAVLEKLDLIQVSSNKVLLVASIRSGVVRTVYVDLPGEVPEETLVTLTLLLNERLAGLTLEEIRETFAARMRDAMPDEDSVAEELLNIFMQSSQEIFDFPAEGGGHIHLGNASVLASQPEFTSGERMRSLLELTERPELLASVLGGRDHRHGIQITIGGEHGQAELADFTLVTAEYRVGGLKGIIGVIGPTRMPYEKVIAIVDHTSSLVNKILE